MSGYVVEHLKTGVRYAVSERNYRPSVHRKVRQLRPGESVWAFKPEQQKTVEGETAKLGKIEPKPTARKPRKGTA